MNTVRVTNKKKPGGITGSEMLNVEDREGRLWDVTLRDIANLQGKVIKIGEITYEDINTLGDDTSFEITFEDAKILNQIFLRGYAKISEEFNSYSYGYSENYITGVTIEAVANTSGSNITYPDSNVQDIKVTLTVNSANMQDWTSGVLDIYIETKKFPV